MAKATSQKHPVTKTKTVTRVVRKTEPAQKKVQPKLEPGQEAAFEQPMPEASVQHVPGQEEIPAVTAENVQPSRSVDEIPVEGNNIAKVRDRAFADTPPANDQPPVEKTFVSS